MKQYFYYTLIPLFLFIQHTLKAEVITNKEDSLTNRQNTYLLFKIGLSNTNFTDFATSPLTYRGVPFSFSFDLVKEFENRETELGFNLITGNVRNTFNNQTSISRLNSLSFKYSYLVDVSIKNKKFMLGGMVLSTNNFRLNNKLQNNQLGLESINNLFASIKTKRNISRINRKHKKFLFLFPYQLQPRKIDLSFQLNVGLINSSYRNGFSYIEHSGVLNKSNIFDSHIYNLFSGFRVGTELDYTVYLNNNAIQFSYIWDAYTTKGEFESFQLANHTFSIGFLFNTKSN